MARLFSYCLRWDDGAAPNPFWGLCTLAICKPRIRQTASVGDWIAGTGSKNAPGGDLSGSLIYAMRVTRKMTMRDYDSFTRTELDKKIPDRRSKDWRRWLGDSIYDFSANPPRQRPGVHGKDDQARDLGGEFALLSDDFLYFGDKPIPIPEDLLPIVLQGQGHRSSQNDPYVGGFVSWIRSLDRPSGSVLGQPQGMPSEPPSADSPCSVGRRLEDEEEGSRQAHGTG